MFCVLNITRNLSNIFISKLFKSLKYRNFENRRQYRGFIDKRLNVIISDYRYWQQNQGGSYFDEFSKLYL